MSTDTTAPQLVDIQQNQNVTLDVSSLDGYDFNPTDLGLKLDVVEDGSGISSMSLQYILSDELAGTNSWTDSFYIYFNTAPDASGYYVPRAGYHHDLNQYLTSGSYELNQISISDRAGNQTYLPHLLVSSLEGENVSYGIELEPSDYSIQIVSTNTDTTAPQLVDIQQNQNVTLDVSSLDGYDFNPTDLGLKLDVVEDGSGISSMSLQYILSDELAGTNSWTDSFYIYFNTAPDASGYYVPRAGYHHDLNQYLTSGSYELNQISISDRAGNQTYLPHLLVSP